MEFNMKSTWEDWAAESDDETYDVEDYPSIEDARDYVGENRKGLKIQKLNIKPIQNFERIELQEKIMKTQLDEEEKRQLAEYKELMKNKLSWATMNKNVVQVLNNKGDDSNYPMLSSKNFVKKPVIKEDMKVKESPISVHVDETGWTTVSNKERPIPEKVVSYTFTKMCSTWFDGKKCNNKKCTYAHKIEQLRINNCSYFSNCNTVCEKNGRIINRSQDKICHKLHLNETRENFLQRVGIQKK